MTAFVALLGAVNVGGRNKISMADLREIVSGVGHTNVSTYIQSGNVIFTSPQRSTSKIETAIEAAIKGAIALDIVVFVRSANDLRKTIADNPFEQRRLEPTRLVVVFLKQPVRKRTIDVSKYGPEEVLISGRELYIHYPNGQGRSKLTSAVLAREIGVPGTARNWNTVGKLLHLAESA
jgi:uncharacterized protein (DUF1697 family)